MNNNEYFAFLNGQLIDSNGFITRYGVTAYRLEDAIRLLKKAKKYYFHRHWPRNSYIKTRTEEGNKIYYPSKFILS